MKKYDCSKTIDFTHETARMCHGFKYCEDGCPLRSLDHPCGLTYTTQETIDAVQKWSDDHLEPPKLTKREFEFLKVFVFSYEKVIEREETRALYMYDKRIDRRTAIDSTMFPFIEKGEEMNFDELLKLEVKE